MSATFDWCKNKTKLVIWDKQVFHVDECGDKWWSLNGKRHRVDGPAVEYSDGGRAWYLNGKLHRENGPAVEYPNGDKWWYFNGELHRDDGPAIEYANGGKSWYFNGKRYSESDYWHVMKETNE